MSEEAQGQIPRGFVLSDSNKKEWIIGSFIGIDGSAENYEGAVYKGEIPTDYPVLIKLRPDGDEKFTLEVNFYKKHASPTEIDKWIASQNILYDCLGLPRYFGFGENVKVGYAHFNFLVLERYGSDLQTLLVKHKNLFPKSTVLKVAYQIVCVLEYLHQRDIVHGDIRASNLRLGWHSERRIYLLPKFHITDESDQNAVTFWSEFQHCEAMTKIGDFESLLYNLIDWSGGILPWKKALPKEAKDMKIQAFENPKQFLQDAFPSCECEDPSECLASRKCTASGKPVAPFKCLLAITELMEQVAFMKKNDECKPNYEVIKEALRKRLLNMYQVPTSKLEFSIPTVIGDEDHGIPYWPGSGIAMDILAIIIAENCSTFDEVDIFDSKPSGVVDVFSEILMKKTNTMSSTEASYIRKAWRRDLSGLRSSVIKQWRLKGIEPGDYEHWKENKDSQKVAKRAEKRASMGAKKKAAKLTDHESPGVSINKENCGGPLAPKDASADMTNGCLSLRPRTQRKRSIASSGNSSPAKLSILGSPPGSIVFRTSQDVHSSSPPTPDVVQSPTSSIIGSKSSSNRRSSQSDLYSEDSPSSRASGRFSNKPLALAESEIVLPHCHVKIVSQVRHQVSQEVVPKTTEVADRTDEQVTEQRRPVPVDCKPWHKTYEWLNAWFGVRTKMLKTLGPISSEPEKLAEQVQELAVLRDEFSMQQPRLRHLVNVLAELPSDSADAQKLSQIERRWLNQLVWLEKRARELGDASPSQLRNVLQDNKSLMWLVKEVNNVPERLLISTDPVTLQRQFEQNKAVCRHVKNKDAEVTKLLNERRDALSRSQNLEDATFQQLFLDVMQYQWNRLKTYSVETGRLKTCTEHCDKYYKVRKLFLDWLGKAEDKLESLKPTSLDNIEEVLKKLSTFSNEVREKLDVFEQTINLGHAFVGVCDQDKDVKDELIVVKDRWAKLNDELPQRRQSLKDTARDFASFNESLRNLKRKLKMCEDSWALHDTLQEVDKNFKLLDSIKELQEETDSLREQVDAIRQEASDLVLKASERGIDASHVSGEVGDVATCIANLKAKLVDTCSETLIQQLVSCERDLQEMQRAKCDVNTVEEKIKKIKTLVSTTTCLFEGISDLVSSVEKVVDLGSATTDLVSSMSCSRSKNKYASARENVSNETLRNVELLSKLINLRKSQKK